MASYLERLCIFICLGDLLANFLPSEKFVKLYRHIAGALILVLIIQPLGKEVAGLVENAEGGIREEFEERIEGQNAFWKAGNEDALMEETENVLEDYLGQMTEEEMKEELAEYGYEVDAESLEKK
ncbi:MAG: hypothetical protein HDR00_14045 [Lachnospiraceae bacterium]|nr:hypothetical protein [Lachnospiraceae bacterium]